MPATIANIKQLVRELELRFWISDDGGRIAIPSCSDDARVRTEAEITVQEDGRFVQFKADLLFNINVEGATFESLLRTVNSMNCEMRFIKIELDTKHQKIRAGADFWAEDGEMTAMQFKTMLGNFAWCALHAQGELIKANDASPVMSAEDEVPF